MYVNREYRDSVASSGLTTFGVSVKETDIFISIDNKSFTSEMKVLVEKLILDLRYELEHYIQADPNFQTALVPHVLLPGAPVIARTMTVAANLAGVGPMAAVAGTFAEFIGWELSKTALDVIVENGGDIFISSSRKRNVAIFAGESPFSNRLGIEIPSDKTPLGICTSSGMVGPSLSFGKADAAVVLAKSTALADAVASAVGNVVHTAGDVTKGIEVAQKCTGVLGALVIKDDQLAVWGDFKVVPISSG